METPEVDHAAGSLGPPRILVVDDSPVVRQLLCTVLGGPSMRAQVQEAASGLAALRMVLGTTPDCVLCDLHMPETNGLFFLRSVRAHFNRMDLPVVLLSGVDSVVDKVAGFRAGASDYITKPFEHDELLARVETQVFVARAARQMKHNASYDALTGLHNRRVFLERLAEEHSRVSRTAGNYGLAMLDIDHFKKVNDTHGHAVGDKVIRGVAEALTASHRTYDVAGRLGGEEFCLLLPGAGLAECLVVAERVRRRVEQTALGGLAAGAVTVSVGVAAHTQGTPYSPELVIENADRCLYQAKDAGRNQVCSVVTAAEISARAPDSAI